MKDEYLPRIFSLIKNESWGFKDNQKHNISTVNVRIIQVRCRQVVIIFAVLIISIACILPLHFNFQL